MVYEPLRPIYAPGDSDPYFYVTLGKARVFYGDYNWPSKSYLMIPGEFYVDSSGEWQVRDNPISPGASFASWDSGGKHLV